MLVKFLLGEIQCRYLLVSPLEKVLFILPVFPLVSSISKHSILNPPPRHVGIMSVQSVPAGVFWMGAELYIWKDTNNPDYTY